MAQLRIGLAQVNATVGDLAGNSDKVIEWTMRAAEQGARIVVFPEMVLTGYPVEDLALRKSFVDASIASLHGLAHNLAAEGLDGVAVVVGYLDRRADQQPRVGVPAGAPQDAAAVLHGGAVTITSAKHHLPNYGVFDEFRYFVPGDTLPVFRLTTGGGEQVDVAVAICEDLWQDGGPVAVTRQAGASLLVVPNASPYERNKDDVRLELCQRRAREAGTVLAYANMVGGQDELVFDGDSIIVAPDGSLLARGPQFDEALVLADLDLPAADPGLPAGRQRANAADGTTMTIERIELAPLPGPDPDAPLARRWCGRGCRTSPRSTARSSSASATTSARTASARSSRGCPAASTRRSSPRSRPTRSARTECTSCSTRAPTRPSTRSPTPRIWPGARASTPASSRSSR